ncbi:MAG: cell division protein ZapA [Methylocystis sp.]|nr:cell division protein ZapA [Methylocystis sp.]
MAAVIVTIAGRSYRMSCADGEEARIEELARYVESKILSLKEGFGEIGEQRLVVMAALAIADEASEAQARAQVAQGEIAALQIELEAARQARARIEARAARALEDAANRLERLDGDLSGPAPQRDDFP